MRRLALITALVATLSCGDSAPPTLRAPTDGSLVASVDPFIGSANEGNTFPGALRPWGMVSVSPHNLLTTPFSFLRGEIAPSGYVEEGPDIRGFGFTHLSGTGCPDLGAPVVMPARAAHVAHYEYRSTYEGEVAFPGYYGVRLGDAAALVETSATERVGLMRVHFDEGGEPPHLLIDVGRSVSWRGGAGSVRVVSPTEVEGSVGVGGFCAEENQSDIHFVLRVDRPAEATGTWEGGIRRDTATATGEAGAHLRFRPGQTVTVRVGVSFVDIDGARRNLDAEAPAGRGFDTIADEATAAWEDALGRVRVTGGTDDDHTRFYTALYHALIHPSIASDVDGRHLRYGDRAVVTADEPRYHVFSLWDTYRTLHPLLTLLYPEVQQRMNRTLAEMTVAAGEPPRWELGAYEVNMMVGDPLAIVLHDAWAKGLRDFDLAATYPILRDQARLASHRIGAAEYETLGYVPMDLDGPVWGPVSTTLEYALADHAIAGLATARGETSDADGFTARSIGYRGLFDPATSLLRPRFADGSFLAPFAPLAITGSVGDREMAGGPGYVEGTAYHYSFMAPHDVPGLIALHGGEAAFVAALRDVFEQDRFTLWNEPDIAYPFLLTRVASGAADGQRWARRSLDVFGTGPDGIPGNDDAGTLSAWFVFAAMGLYPDLPGDPTYALGAPLFDRVVLARPDGEFVIEVGANGPGARHVANATLDGASHDTARVSHDAIVGGSELSLTLAP